MILLKVQTISWSGFWSWGGEADPPIADEPGLSRTSTSSFGQVDPGATPPIRVNNEAFYILYPRWIHCNAIDSSRIDSVRSFSPS